MGRSGPGVTGRLVILRGIPTQQGLKRRSGCGARQVFQEFSEVFQHNKD